MTDGNDLAFPQANQAAIFDIDLTIEENEARISPNSGLTKREYFAAMVLAGIVANHTCTEDPRILENRLWVETAAVRCADDLIAALNAE